jgi:hypothetical protein
MEEITIHYIIKKKFKSETIKRLDIYAKVKLTFREFNGRRHFVLTHKTD